MYVHKDKKQKQKQKKRYTKYRSDQADILLHSLWEVLGCAC
jgi:hypothetical protein